MNFFNRLFRQSSLGLHPQQASKNVAKERLKLALTYDRGGLAHGTIEQMRDEILGIIAKHLDISEEEIEINFDSSAEYGKLIASIPLHVGQRPRPVGSLSAETTDNPPPPAAVTPSEEVTPTGFVKKITKKRRHR